MASLSLLFSNDQQSIIPLHWIMEKLLLCIHVSHDIQGVCINLHGALSLKIVKSHILKDYGSEFMELSETSNNIAYFSLNISPKSMP